MEINQLAFQAKNGDMEAFEQLHGFFSERILRFIQKKIQNLPDAEDVLQEVFIKSYKGLKSLRPGKLYFSTWLYKIATNSINDYFRKKYRRPEVVSINETFDFPDGKSLDKEIMAKSDLETVKESFNRLPELHRDILELRFFKDLTLNETAKVLHKSNLAVRLLQCRARKKLKDVTMVKLSVR